MKKRTITNRKTNYIVFEFGLRKIEEDLLEIGKLKILCDEIGMYTGTYKHDEQMLEGDFNEY